MKIPRGLIGKLVELVWRDPCTAHVKSHARDGSDIPRGRAILAYQTERGRITDVTEGVVRLEHTRGEDSPLTPDPSTDLSCTWIVEDLIESLTVYEPVPVGPTTA